MKIKDTIRKTFLLSAVIILAVFFLSFLMIGITPEIVLVFEIYLFSLGVILIQVLLKRLIFKHFLLNITTEYISISVLLLLYGYFVGWFLKTNWWMALVYVAIVYFPSYFLDMAIVKKDINYINDKLEKRKDKNEGQKS